MWGSYFFGTQLVKLMKASICRYDVSTGDCQTFGEKQEAYTTSEEQKKILENCFHLQQNEYPKIHMLEADILVAEISHTDAPNVWSLFGPILLAPTSEKTVQSCEQEVSYAEKGRIESANV